MGNPELTSPPSVATNIQAWASEIDHLLLPLAVGRLQDINSDSDSRGVVIYSFTPYRWSDLPAEAHANQARALEEYRAFSDTLQVLIRAVPEDRLEKFTDDSDHIIRFISRGPSGYETPERALEAARAALRRQAELVDGLFGPSNDVILVPDTNALYWNTALDAWRVPWQGGAFVVALTPTVLREIDLHKADERRSSRREKAERFARQVGEYRRRGSLLRGVTLASGISTVKSIAVEPKMSESLSWLDPASPDDRLLASVIEVMRQNPRASVIAVTRDTNFANKLDMARVPFVGPDAVAPNPVTD